jgi:hypothetical protein
MKPGESRIRDQLARVESSQPRFAGKRLERPVAGRRAQQIHDLQFGAIAQMFDARIADVGLPANLEFSQARQMPEHLQARIGNATARVVAEIQAFQLWHARQMPEARIGQMLAATEIETRDVLQLGHPAQDFVGHLPVGVQGGNPLRPHGFEQGVPLPIGEFPTRSDSRSIDLKRITGWWLTTRLHQSPPVSVARRPRQELLRVGQCKTAGARLGLSHLVNRVPDISPHVGPRRGPPAILIESLEGRGIVPLEDVYQVGGQSIQLRG